MKRLILALGLAMAALAACDEPRSEQVETALPPIEEPAALPPVEPAPPPVVQTPVEAPVDPTALPPDTRPSEETVKPESETLFY